MSEEEKKENIVEAEVAVLAPSAIMAMERAAIDGQVATAKHYPRSIAVFLKGAQEMACADEEVAESCIYSRPVGRKQNPQTKQWEDEYAEGASIRLAEIVAANYGNIRCEAMIVEQTERYVKCAGMAYDLQSNYAGKSEVIEATVKKDGTPYSERQRALVAKVCLSKAYRDAVFRVVPKALCKPVMDAAKKVITGQGKTIEQRQARVKSWLASIQVNDERVFHALGVKGWPDIGNDQLIKLTGLKTAISDGEETPISAFPEIPKSPVQSGPPETSAAATIDHAAQQAAEKAAAEIAKPCDHLLGLIKESGVSQEQVVAYAKKNNLCGAKVEEVIQFSDSNCRKIIAAWPTTLPKIKEIKL